ncbi:MAG TPA: EAL domain-containing protein [Solirubrobacteraceae bacterium]|jgi:EAL domain-containing protein (putative c-di-GMP-specific phosphodiesterase class I)|nr:EAL domain-containing protein [Solirubrobacteraceae bacterium]
MPSSTTAHASHHLLLRAAAARAQRRYREAEGLRATRGFSSPAGLHRRPWLARLRRALEKGLFELHYQPIVSLRDGSVSHHEALVRLADEPHGRLVSPGSFLPAAERYGLVREIDRLVLGRVAATLGREPGGSGPVAINLSTLSVTDGSMLGAIERALDRHGADPGQLIVEVTETAAISDMDRARDFCDGVRSLGCAVALDDFGSGFGSFQYLKHLPFDFLKIDGDFIRALPSSPTDQLVVKALVDVVAGMGRRTIAEFVGDAVTLELLRDFGVDHAQGFQVGMPAPRMIVTA